MKLRQRRGENLQHFNLRKAGLSEGRIRYAMREQTNTQAYLKGQGVSSYRIRRAREIDQLPALMADLRERAKIAKDAKLGELNTYDAKRSNSYLNTATRKELEQIIEWDADSLQEYTRIYVVHGDRPNPFWYR